MLALSRKKDEAIILDGQIEIRILEVQGDKVKLGINAPKDVSIYREEVYEQISSSNKEAVEVDKGHLLAIKELFLGISK